jgi:hypothetical protein
VPFHDLLAAGAAVDEDGESAGEDDVQSGDRNAFVAEDFAFVQMAEGAVGGQPGELFRRGGAEGGVVGEAVEKVCHLVAPDDTARQIAELCLKPTTWDPDVG